MTALEFELHIRSLLERSAGLLRAFNVTHRERIGGLDGEYEFDVVVRFEALGAEFVTLVECKNVKRPVERADIQVLNDRLRSVGGQKGILFATAGFQSGAVEYATNHGIALVQVVDNEQVFITRSSSIQRNRQSPWLLTLWDWDGAKGPRRRLMEAEGAEGYLRQFVSGHS